VLHVLAGLSTGHKIGLGVVGAVFIAFALSASFLAPRRWPDFPGRHGLSPFVIACFVVFAGMLASVYFFGKESEEAKGAESAPAAPSATSETIKVTEKEYRIVLPTLSGLKQGRFTFRIHNAGQVAHNLAITGPRVSGSPISATIPPGGDGTLQVTLGAAGNYTLFCAIDDHRKLGMVAKLAVS
jgi:plastocyanin